MLVLLILSLDFAMDEKRSSSFDVVVAVAVVAVVGSLDWFSGIARCCCDGSVL